MLQYNKLYLTNGGIFIKDLKLSEPLVIIFVDDEVQALTIFKHAFKEEIRSKQVKLLTFAGGKECMEYLSENSFEKFVMFSDINMPYMDGFSLVNRVRGICPDSFFISAYDQENYKLRADVLGVKGSFSRPVSFKAIKSVSRDYVEIKKYA